MLEVGLGIGEGGGGGEVLGRVGGVFWGWRSWVCEGDVHAGGVWVFWDGLS